MRSSCSWALSPLSLFLVGLAIASITACQTDSNGLGPPDQDGSFDGSMDASLDTSTDDVAHADVLSDVAVDVSSADAADASLTDAAEASTTDAADAAEASVACNASNCGGACCGDHCIARTCFGCELGSFFCGFNGGSVQTSNGTCVSDCSACMGAPEDSSAKTSACFRCANGVTVSTCVWDPGECSTSDACNCATASDTSCSAPDQACAFPDASAVCVPCGQPGTDGQPCGSGKVCNESQAKCAP